MILSKRGKSAYSNSSRFTSTVQPPNHDRQSNRCCFGTRPNPGGVGGRTTRPCCQGRWPRPEHKIHRVFANVPGGPPEAPWCGGHAGKLVCNELQAKRGRPELCDFSESRALRGYRLQGTAGTGNTIRPMDDETDVCCRVLLALRRLGLGGLATSRSAARRGHRRCSRLAPLAQPPQGVFTGGRCRYFRNESPSLPAWQPERIKSAAGFL